MSSTLGNLLPPNELANLLGDKFCKELVVEAYKLSKDKKRFKELVTMNVDTRTPVEQLIAGSIKLLPVQGTSQADFTELYQAGFQNCQGQWQKKGECRTLGCMNTRALNDHQGYCIPCKVEKGIIKQPKQKGVRKLSVEELEHYKHKPQISTPAFLQEAFIDDAKEFILKFDKTNFFMILLSKWSKLPLTLKQEIVSEVMKSHSNVVEFPQGAQDASTNLSTSHGNSVA